MQNFLIIFSVVISVFLIIVVLVQKSKGGGLASNFAGSNQIMGVRRTNNFIEKATWTLAIIICFLSLMSGILMRGNSGQADDIMVKDTNAMEQIPGSFNTETATDEAAPVANDEAVVTDEAVTVEETALPADAAPAEGE